MTDRDRLAADLLDADAFGWLVARSAEFDDDYFRRRADRLIALGWTRLDESREPRGSYPPCRSDLACFRNDGHTGNHAYPLDTKAYREDTDA